MNKFLSYFALSVLAVSGSLLQGCTASVADVNEPPDIPRPRFSTYCHLDPTACDNIYESINYLVDHPYGPCRDAGEAALARYNGSEESGIGFEQGDDSDVNSNAYVYGEINDPGQNTYSGWHAIDGRVYINTWGAIQPTESLGGTIAHEEQHQNGMDGPHNTGVAALMSAVCSQI